MSLVGMELGKYKLVELLGQGGMGTVYRAYHETLDRHVAVKLLHSTLSQDTNHKQRFIAEARLAGMLEHSHIIPVYDFGIEMIDDVEISYIVMRMLTGGSLADRMIRDKDGIALPTVHEVARITEMIADALDYAHGRNVVHRDVKPSNILFDSNYKAYLVDFGIAKLAEAVMHQTTHNTMIGTPLYMAPEMWEGGKITGAVDQYALGILVYQLLTGRMPFNAETPTALIQMHIHQPPIDIRTYRADLPPDLMSIFSRALAKNPGDRFAHVADFAQALKNTIRSMSASESSFFDVAALLKKKESMIPSEGTPTARRIDESNARLVLMRSPGLTGKAEWRVNKSPFTIGRRAEGQHPDLTFNGDADVEPLHVVITHVEDHFIIQDQQTESGTYIHNRRINSPFKVGPGSLILMRLGRHTELQFIVTQLTEPPKESDMDEATSVDEVLSPEFVTGDLEVISGEALVGQTWKITYSPFVMGRDSACDACFSSIGGISGRHAQLTQSEGVYYLEDLGSRNGTYLSGQPLDPGKKVRLEPHKEYKIGMGRKTVIKFSYG